MLGLYHYNAPPLMAKMTRHGDRGDLSMLKLLDLSAAFDTVDHSILLHRLKTSYGLNARGVVHMWISSYLTNRTQYVCCPESRSTPLPVLCGVPQRSVLGPLLVLLYTADLVQLVESIGLYPHLYADDTQIYGFCQPGATDSVRTRVADCVTAVADWMRSSRLQLNASKTEVCASARRQSQLPSDTLAVGQLDMFEVLCCTSTGTKHTAVRVTGDVTVACRGAGVLKNRLWLCNPCRPSESAAGQAARLIFTASRRDHVQPLLCSLHWL